MDLFPPALRPDTFQSPGIRISPVLGDNMEPTLRSRFDYVVCAPTDRYDGEGLYLIDQMGAGVVYRCQCGGNGLIWLLSDNKHYSRKTVTPEQFSEIVLAKVVADVKVRDEGTLRCLVQH